MDDKLINLIVIDDSFDSEEQIVSKLRAAGYTARSSRVEDDEDLLESIEAHAPDLVLYFDNMEFCKCPTKRFLIFIQKIKLYKK